MEEQVPHRAYVFLNSLLQKLSNVRTFYLNNDGMMLNRINTSRIDYEFMANLIAIKSLVWDQGLDFTEFVNIMMLPNVEKVGFKQVTPFQSKLPSTDEVVSSAVEASARSNITKLDIGVTTWDPPRIAENPLFLMPTLKELTCLIGGAGDVGQLDGAELMGHLLQPVEHCLVYLHLRTTSVGQESARHTLAIDVSHFVF